MNDNTNDNNNNIFIRALTRDYKPGTAQSVTIVSLVFGDTFFGIFTNLLNFDAAMFAECIAHKTVTKKRCRKKRIHQHSMSFFLVRG